LYTKNSIGGLSDSLVKFAATKTKTAYTPYPIPIRAAEQKSSRAAGNPHFNSPFTKGDD